MAETPKKTGTKTVGTIFETWDYDQFKILDENRGHKETKGIKEKKIKTLQRMIDAGNWIPEMARVKVNNSFQIVDGAHTFEVSKRNGLPIRYEITGDPRFNECTKRDLIGSVYLINSVSTAWRSDELFAAAIQTKAPLALAMQQFIESFNNYFLWMDLMGLLTRDTGYFIGRWRKTTMATFEDKELIQAAASDEFYLEIKSFAKLHLKARISPKKGFLIKAAYDILWHVREMINPILFRKSLASIPDTLVMSERTKTDDGCRRLLIQHYNKSQGQSVETATIMYALAHKDSLEPVLEIE